jgi:hypothetical protein
MSEIIIRKVTVEDFENVCNFVDKWLSGRAIAEGGGNDYFVSKEQHKSYFKNCHVLIALDNNKIIGWGVKEKSGVLIHLLVAGDYRGKGIGGMILKELNPQIIRSKSDQQTGDPKEFYMKYGYKSFSANKVGKKSNIELMTK